MTKEQILSKYLNAGHDPRWMQKAMEEYASLKCDPLAKALKWALTELELLNDETKQLESINQQLPFAKAALTSYAGAAEPAPNKVASKQELTDLRNSFYDQMPSRGEIKAWDMIEWAKEMFKQFDAFIDQIEEAGAAEGEKDTIVDYEQAKVNMEDGLSEAEAYFQAGFSSGVDRERLRAIRQASGKEPEKKDPWISVDDRLPNETDGLYVLIDAEDADGDREIYKAYLGDDNKSWYWRNMEFFNVTQWCRIPQPPAALKEEEGKNDKS